MAQNVLLGYSIIYTNKNKGIRIQNKKNVFKINIYYNKFYWGVDIEIIN